MSARAPVDRQAGEATQPLGREGAAAWEEIEAGRYMPRRIRGSLRGRELG